MGNIKTCKGLPGLDPNPYLLVETLDIRLPDNVVVDANGIDAQGVQPKLRENHGILTRLELTNGAYLIHLTCTISFGRVHSRRVICKRFIDRFL